MNAQRQELLSIAEQAAMWLRLMSSANDRQAEFWAWLTASPAHIRELLLAIKLDEELGLIDPDSLIDVKALALQAQAAVVTVNPSAQIAPTEPARRPATTRRSAIAAVAAMTLFAAWGGWYFLKSRDTYATQVGEQHFVELADGSTLFLNTQSKVTVRFDELSRDIYMDHGQALFQVHHDSQRPFRVHAAQAVIQAVGTQFDVRVDAGTANVAVVEGIVQVFSDQSNGAKNAGADALPPPTRVSAGGGATIDPHGKIEPAARIDAEAVTAWRQQRLVFLDTPLAHIAAEFNRYNRTPQLIVDPALADKPLNGVFNARNPDSLIRFLAEDPAVICEQRGDVIFIRSRIQAAASR